MGTGKWAGFSTRLAGCVHSQTPGFVEVKLPALGGRLPCLASCTHLSRMSPRQKEKKNNQTPTSSLPPSKVVLQVPWPQSGYDVQFATEFAFPQRYLVAVQALRKLISHFGNEEQGIQDRSLIIQPGSRARAIRVRRCSLQNELLPWQAGGEFTKSPGCPCVPLAVELESWCQVRKTLTP